MDGLALLAEARAAGLDVLADGGRLVVRGPADCERLARRLLAHKRAVLTALALDDWREWTERRDGQAWNIIERPGSSVVPWEGCKEWPERRRWREQQQTHQERKKP